MKFPFEKRRVFRSVMRPYKPLGDEDRDVNFPHVYARQLVGTEVPRDRHFKYSIVLVEYNPPEGVTNLPVDEKSSCHPTFSKTRDGHDVIVAYIVLVKSEFSPTNVQQLTERLLCFAHELLYVAQYPPLVAKHNGAVTEEILRNEIVTPDPDEEEDLVCSFCTIAKFFNTIEAELGIKVHDLKALKTFRQSQLGATRLQKHWDEDHSLAQETVYPKMTEYILRGYGKSLPILKECYNHCSSSHGEKCMNAKGIANLCPTCSNFSSFVDQFHAHGEKHYGCDREFATYLCSQERHSLLDNT